MRKSYHALAKEKLAEAMALPASSLRTDLVAHWQQEIREQNMGIIIDRAIRKRMEKSR